MGRTGCRLCSVPIPRESKQLQSPVGPTRTGRKRSQVYLTGHGPLEPLTVCCNKHVPPRVVTKVLALFCVSNASGPTRVYRFIGQIIYFHFFRLILPPAGYLQL